MGYGYRNAGSDPPSYFLVHSQESSVWQGNAPTSDDVNRAWNGTRLPVGASWVSPRVRITRHYETGALEANITTAANVVALANAADVTALLALLGTSMGDGNWTDPTAEPYREAINGPLAWWQSGEAAVTRTQDAWPELGGRLDPQENPWGPTTPATHPGTIADAARGASPWLLGALALGALIVLAPSIDRASKKLK